MQSQDFGCKYTDCFGIKSLFVVSMMSGGTLQVQTNLFNIQQSGLIQSQSELSGVTGIDDNHDIKK